MAELIQGQLDNYAKARRGKDISLPLLHLVGNLFNLFSRLLFHRCFWRLDDFLHYLLWRTERGLSNEKRITMLQFGFVFAVEDKAYLGHFQEPFRGGFH